MFTNAQITAGLFTLTKKAFNGEFSFICNKNVYMSYLISEIFGRRTLIRNIQQNVVQSVLTD